MSLVVAEIHGDAISLVGDTKVTRPMDEHRTRHVFENVFPKVLLLRPELCVGLAGNDPERAAAAMVEARDRPTAELVDLGSSLPFASFIIAELLSSPRLFAVTAGTVEDRTDLGRAWVGDATAYGGF